jgi:hypothetical protein
MKKFLWIGVFAVAGCSVLSKPVTNPETGEPVMRPDGTQQTVYDDVTETGLGILGLFNPMWVPLAGAAAALGREKLFRK